MESTRPVLFLDVDGPLNPFRHARRPSGYTTLRVPTDRLPGPRRRDRTLRVWLNPEHGRFLLHCGYDLCWATTCTVD